MTNLSRYFWIKGRRSLLLIACLLLASLAPAQARAQALQIFSLAQRDLDADGQPDETVIEAAFATARDRITVLDQRGDMIASDSWQSATDFYDDVWLYDIGADDDVELVVAYDGRQGYDSARIYSDVTGDGAVAYRRAGLDIQITESPYWSAQIVSSSRWRMPDGRLNLNFRIATDGTLTTFDRMPLVYRQQWLKHDGKPDAEAESHADASGIGTYVLTRLTGDSPSDWGFQRTSLQVNSGRYPTGTYDNAFFPLLPIPKSAQDPKNVFIRYFDRPLVLGIDWERGLIIGPVMFGYPIGHGYHLNSDTYVKKSAVNDVSFESPQAYYDLAQNHDAFAELHIRFFTRPGDDRAMWTLPGQEAIPWQSISYSWNLFNPGTLRWDYKLGLAGNYVIDEVTNYPDFKLRHVPFEQLPGWIVEREWKLTTFVAREGAGYESSEGIYEWQTDTGEEPESGDKRSEITREATQSYQQGLSVTPPDQHYTHTRVGFRGEYHFASPQRPRLYFSPIDRRVHLHGAEAGTWNIDNQAEMRYANLDGDAYLDQWEYRVGGRTRQQLNVFRDYLLYSDGRSVLLKRAIVEPALFELLPPRSHSEWDAQRRTLEALQKGFKADDLQTMFEQFPGPVWRLEGARLRAARPQAAGFRFVIEVEPGARAAGDPELRLPTPAAGRQVVSYAEEGFQVAPLTPPAITATLSAGPTPVLQIAPVMLQLRNHGMQDVVSATLELWATAPSGAEEVVAKQRVDLLASAPVTTTFTWTPAEAGVWSVSPYIREASGRLTALPSAKVTILPVSAPPMARIVTVSIGWGGAGLAALALLGIALIAALTVWKQWRATP